jgi:Ca-activated chloride channel homolog
MNAFSLRGRELPRLAWLLSRITFLLALTVLASRPAVAATGQPSPAGSTTLTDLSKVERPDLTNSHLAAHAPSAQIDFAPDSRLVTVKTFVENPEAPSLTNVHPGSFVVYEDGLRQHDVNVAVEHAPLSLGILLEYGGRYHALNQIRGEKASAAAKELLNEIGADDRVAVWKYADSVEPISEWSAPGAESLQRTQLDLSAPPVSELNLYDAIVSTLPKMQAMPGRKALVLISSGVDTFSKASFADALIEARSAGIPIYVVNLGPLMRSALLLGSSEEGPYGSLNWTRAESELGKLARASGGQMCSPESSLDLTGVYDELLAKLRVQYVIQYKSHDSESSSKPRTVRVEFAESRSASSPSAALGTKGAHGRLIAEAEYVPGMSSRAQTNISASTGDVTQATPPPSASQ